MDEPKSHDHADPGKDADWARSLHDRTGEVELIISAALVFGLFQAPGALDGWFDRIQFRLAGSFYTTVFVAWYYTKLIVLTLMGSFSLHLLARAYWIGLLGLDSAFPQGIRWEHLKYGPHTLREYQRRLAPVPSLARRADAVASTIFAAGFWIALIFATSVLMAGGAGLATLALIRWVIPGARPPVVWGTLMVVLAAIPVIVIVLDRFLGDRLDPESGLARLIGFVVGKWYLFFAGPILLPIQFTLFTNLRRRFMWGAMMVVFGCLMGAFIVGERVRRGDWFMSGSEFFPTRTGPLVSNERYYEDQDPDYLGGVPTIPSDVILGAFVRLRIPFTARRDALRLREACPDLPVVGRSGMVTTTDRGESPSAEDAELLRCMTGLWTVALDGTRQELAWSFSSAGGNGISGVVAYIPTRDLALGSHVLEITEVRLLGASDPGAPSTPAGASGADSEAPEPRRHFIRFWVDPLHR